MAHQITLTVDDLNLHHAPDIEQLMDINQLSDSEFCQHLTDIIHQKNLDKKLRRADMIFITGFEHDDQWRFFWDGQIVVPQQLPNFGLMPDQFLVPTDYNPDHWGFEYGVWFDLPKFRSEVINNLSIGLTQPPCLHTTLKTRNKTFYLIFTDSFEETTELEDVDAHMTELRTRVTEILSEFDQPLWVHPVSQIKCVPTDTCPMIFCFDQFDDSDEEEDMDDDSEDYGLDDEDEMDEMDEDEDEDKDEDEEGDEEEMEDDPVDDSHKGMGKNAV